jgi:sec-independent protein translocase protein TatB
MFDLFSGSHLLILLTVLLVVVGPKDLPRLMRTMGQWTGKARRMASEFKKSFDDMARQEELDRLRVEIDELRKTNLEAAELSQKVAEADLPAPEPRSGEFQINETPAPGSAPMQVNHTPLDAFPQGKFPEPEPASALDEAHKP